jgi:hypothetical protein
MKFKKTLKEISSEVVEIVNNENSSYDVEEKVLDHLACYLRLSKDYVISVNLDEKK